MKLRELYRIYDGYHIIVFGRPLNQPTTPFTMLPRNKELMECRVMDYKVERKEQDIPCFKLTTKGIKHYKTDHILGNVYVYVK